MRPLADVKDTASIPSIEKIETASSAASGQYSVQDSAEDALEVALMQKHKNSFKKEGIPVTVNNTKQGSVQDFDETDDLFKPPSDGDQFFKVHSDTFQVTDLSQNSTSNAVNSTAVNGDKHRYNFSPSPSPISNDGNLLNVKQSNMNRENSISSLSCDFSSGEETQNSPGNPILLSSGCDTLVQNETFLGSNTVDKHGDNSTTGKQESDLDEKEKNAQGR